MEENGKNDSARSSGRTAHLSQSSRKGLKARSDDDDHDDATPTDEADEDRAECGEELHFPCALSAEGLFAIPYYYFEIPLIGSFFTPYRSAKQSRLCC